MYITRLLIPLLLLIQGTASVRPSLVHAQSVAEYEVKAAMVYNFLRFTSLPNHQEPSDIHLCIAVRNEHKPSFEALTGRLVRSSAVKVFSVIEAKDVTRAHCHALMLSSHISLSRFGDINTLSEKGILTIGDHNQFLQQGGMIRFYNASQRIRFEIANDVAQKGGVQISSKVLALAHKKDGSD